eukprot:scaffold11976_cov101-Isochrysis_galbana.AAC.1
MGGAEKGNKKKPRTGGPLTLRLMVAAFSLPTYRSSSVTGSSISMFRPRLVCCPPPPPKNMSNGEPPPPACSCAPLRAALMPPKSYSTRRSLSERISYASVTSRKRTWRAKGKKKHGLGETTRTADGQTNTEVGPAADETRWQRGGDTRASLSVRSGATPPREEVTGCAVQSRAR